MDTPVLDFVRGYAADGGSRFHMPGHKGRSLLGIEALDITEVFGADALYEADGIIARSEKNAAKLFGTGRTLFSTEGSSQCVRAMLYLALTCRKRGAGKRIVAARNVHKSFVYAAALLDFEPVWLWPEGQGRGLCSCPVTPEGLKKTLDGLSEPPAAVYVTSPDYLGGRQDIAALAKVCHAYDTLLLVDNAHGAYLHYLEPACHPMDLGADLCCDSAHKTLPVLTGGAYLHLAKHLPGEFSDRAKGAMGLFGSTSPSYLTLASLDACNAYLSDGYAQRLKDAIARLDDLKGHLERTGWPVLESDPLRLTICCSKVGLSGGQLARRLREGNVECEFADPDYLVCMMTPENTPEDLERLKAALGAAPEAAADAQVRIPRTRPETVCSPRQAVFARQETVKIEDATGRICGTPTVACPPAIPIVVSGERIQRDLVELMRCYGMEKIQVVAEKE
ncbi:MAG: aminotransferase class I/II-fold pyridoxal phosphate-dependent enzyme [Oscillospiraceae bacterium]|nr:aminotransferase class I/II-fold pyridoxal phosphate-dependent enzyme [Oscillospiraceae bacterium]